MPGFFVERQPSLRAGVQRFGGRDRYRLGFVHFALELFQGGARFRRLFFLRFRFLDVYKRQATRCATSSMNAE